MNSIHRGAGAWACALGLLALLAGAGETRAQTGPAAGYPSAKTIRMVVGFAAGGGNDIFARIIAPKLQERLGQTVVVENKPGAGGRLAAEYVAAQPADGYTILLGASGAMAISPAVYERMGYSTLKDFVPISKFAAFPLILVTYPAHPAHTVAELITWLKANPDKANYATASAAFTLATELFKLRTGAPATPIPYKGSGESIVSVISHQSTFTIVDPPPATPQVLGGQLRALGIAAGKRLPELPDVPTFTEAGVADADVSLWSGLFAPTGTAPAIVKRIETEIRAVMKLPEVSDKFRQLGVQVVDSSSEDFIHAIDTEIKRWTDVAKRANVKIE